MRCPELHVNPAYGYFDWIRGLSVIGFLPLVGLISVLMPFSHILCERENIVSFKAVVGTFVFGHCLLTFKHSGKEVRVSGIKMCRKTNNIGGCHLREANIGKLWFCHFITSTFPMMAPTVPELPIKDEAV